jgi:hypothetical protein
VSSTADVGAGTGACPTDANGNPTGGNNTGGTGTCNPLTASDSPHVASTTPDLKSVALEVSSNQIVYTFDQAVTGADAVATGFKYYNVDGTQVECGVDANCTQQPGPNAATQYIVQFNTDMNGNPLDLSNAVGGAVDSGAVVGAGGTSGLPNHADELGAANPIAVTITPGTVDGPQLKSAKFTSTTDPNTGVTTNTVLYTFSQAVFSGSAFPGGFHFYDSDGSEFTATSCTTGNAGGTGTNTVSCGSYQAGDQNHLSGFPPTQLQFTQATLATADWDAVFGAGQPQSDNFNPNPENGVAATH